MKNLMQDLVLAIEEGDSVLLEQLLNEELQEGLLSVVVWLLVGYWQWGGWFWMVLLHIVFYVPSVWPVNEP